MFSHATVARGTNLNVALDCGGASTFSPDRVFGLVYVAQITRQILYAQPQNPRDPGFQRAVGTIYQTIRLIITGQARLAWPKRL